MSAFRAGCRPDVSVYLVHMRRHSPIFRADFPKLQSLLLLIFFLCIGMIWVRTLGIITTPADIGYPESAPVETARLASQTGRLYPGFEAPPYTPAPYGPLFYVMLAAAGRLCNGDAYAIRVLLRSIVFASYVFLGLMGYLLARNAGATRHAAALGAAAIWTAPQLWMYWNVSARPDFPGLLLSFGGIWFVSRRASPTVRSVILAAACCASAILVKQSYLAAPLAIALYFLYRRSFRQFFVFAGSGLLVGLSVLGYLALRGEPVIREVLADRYIPRSIHGAAVGLYSSLSVGLAVLVIAGGIAGALLALRSSEHWQAQLLSLYFLLTLLLTSLALLNTGRNGYYLFEIWSVACVLAATVAPQAETMWEALSQPMRVGATVGLLLLGAQSILAIRHPVETIYEYHFEKLNGLHILSEDPTFSARGKTPELLDPWLTAVLERNHAWNPSGILDEIRGEQFDVVFQDQIHSRFSPSLLEAIGESYQELCRSSTAQVMVPRSRKVRFSISDASYTLSESCE
jgi:hypothetical protein